MTSHDMTSRHVISCHIFCYGAPHPWHRGATVYN